MKRYTIETGKFGQYFRDNKMNRDLGLEEVAALLNGEDTFAYHGDSLAYDEAAREEAENQIWQEQNRA